MHSIDTIWGQIVPHSGIFCNCIVFSDTSCIRTQYVGRFSGSDAHLFAAKKEILVQPDCN